MFTAYPVLYAFITYINGRLIDYVVAGNMDGMLWTALLCAGLTVVGYGMDAALTSSRLAMLADGEVGMKAGIMKNLLFRPLKKFRAQSDAYYLNLLTTDVEMYQKYLRFIPLFFTSAASILAASWMLFWMHPVLLPAALVSAVVPLVAVEPFSRLGNKCNNDYSKAAEEYTNVLKENIEGCETIRISGAETAFQQRYVAAGKTRQRAWSRAELVGEMGYQTLLTVATLASIVCTVLGGWLTIKGIMSIEMLVAAKTYFVNISNYFSNLTSYIVEIRSTKKVREKLHDQMDMPWSQKSGQLLPAEPEINYDQVISGGERQRINIARALRRHPKILIFDEPTTGLDPENVAMIDEFIFNLQGVTRIVISHNWAEEYLGRFDDVVEIGNRNVN